jgi:DNA-binding XRE family transcriptional regulator
VWAGQAPDAAEYGYADAASLVGEFFPGATERVLGAADDLVSRNRRHTLAGERIRLGLSQAQVAARMGVRQERVSAIERAEPGAIEVRTLASYVEALGGQLEILANFGDHRATLR